jgi:hypothetical protein
MPRRLVPAIFSVAILVGVAAPPVVAQQADPILTALNGLPGQRMEVCLVSGATKTEIVSSIRYGRFSTEDVVPAGTYTVQGRAYATGTCKGKLLASTTALLEADANYTVVFWKPASSIRAKLFRNDAVLPAGAESTLVLRHMAKAEPIDAWVWLHARPAALDPTFKDLPKGTSSSAVALRDGQVFLEAYLVYQKRARKYELWQDADSGYAYQAYLIGTSPTSFRLLWTRQAGVPAAP